MMLDDFMVRAALAGVGVAIAAAPLGCFVVWRKMAYFGDAAAHAAILGVAISLALSISVFAGVLAVALLMALSVSGLAGRGHAVDTLLGVLAHAALAAGLVAASFLSGVRIDLMAYLFGDILAVTAGDLAVIWGGAIAVIVLIALRWSALLIATLDADLAASEGFDPKRLRFVLILSLAIVVAVAIKVVGALLISAMLVIPAATARPFSRTPEAMAIAAAVIGAGAALGGLGAAYHFDTPTGPTIVCAAAAMFALSTAVSAIRSG